jgi:hypothetical protein
MEFSLTHYKEIKKIKEIEKIEIYFIDNFTKFYEVIYKNDSDSSIYTYIDKCMFMLFFIFFNKFNYHLQHDWNWEKNEKFKSKIVVYTEFGATLKKYPFVFLTKFPEGALKILNSCNDDEEYCVMSMNYYFADYKRVNYLCEKTCEKTDSNEIKRINEKGDLTSVHNNEHYLYCILPSHELCLFFGNHSAGACGQPVISAGYISVLNGEITKINNSSGHYSPRLYMLKKGMDILNTSGILDIDKFTDSEYNSENIITFKKLVGGRHHRKLKTNKKTKKCKKRNKCKKRKTITKL